MKNKLDFLIIGAQKSGTTTLFEWLKDHPDVWMPAGKEAPFFTRDDHFEKGLDTFLENFYKGAEEDKQWGKASPQYLADPRAPKRIADAFPDVKLIAILREPVSRAKSHYNMSLRKDLESRTQEEVFTELMKPATAAECAKMDTSTESETQTYLAWSEYGRQIDAYLKHFKREQMLILTLDEMKNDPEGFYVKVLEFLGIDTAYRPEDLGKAYYVGGAKEWFPAARKIVHSKPIAPLWFAIPEQHRSKIAFWVLRKNIRKGSATEDELPPEVDQKLYAFFEKDIAHLEKLSGLKTGWNKK